MKNSARGTDFLFNPSSMLLWTPKFQPLFIFHYDGKFSCMCESKASSSVSEGQPNCLQIHFSWSYLMLQTNVRKHFVVPLLWLLFHILLEKSYLFLPIRV